MGAYSYVHRLNTPFLLRPEWRTIECIQPWEEQHALIRIGFVSIITLLVALPVGAQDRGARGGAGAPPMTMTVAGFPDGGQFPVKFSQAAEGVAPGEGTSPPISWANVPAGTQGFVLHMHDMDLARTGQRMIRFIGSCGIFRLPPLACRRRSEGISNAERQLPDQCDRPNVSRSRCSGEWTVPSLCV